MVEEHARARLPTRHGNFELVSFVDAAGRKLDDFAIMRGDVHAADVVPVRVHSECVTGDVLGSLRCDCGEQLQHALAELGAREHGALVYLRQEGRGIGIANKVAAYALQDGGLDTVEANLHLGFDDDLRTYEIAGAMLRALGIGKVELITNNPRKLEGLRAAGIQVLRRIPIVIPARPENAAYLHTKRTRSGHEAE
ncbi:MAG: GTP cyclohydrolase II [Deltaproteobacteria bacterium]|nr:GTP cyclohydrolase II [Nannocystaceae bacterium]